MYVCHCNRIPEHEIKAAIAALDTRAHANPPGPADVLAKLNRSGKCLGCFPLIATMLDARHGASTAAVTAPAEPAFAPEPAPRQRRRGGAFARRNGNGQ